MRRILVVAMGFTSKERRSFEVIRGGTHARKIKDVVISDITVFMVLAGEQQVKTEGNI